MECEEVIIDQRIHNEAEEAEQQKLAKRIFELNPGNVTVHTGKKIRDSNEIVSSKTACFKRSKKSL